MLGYSEQKLGLYDNNFPDLSTAGLPNSRKDGQGICGEKGSCNCLLQFMQISDIIVCSYLFTEVIHMVNSGIIRKI